MPDVDGFTLVETIREDPATANLPVVMLTSAHVQDESDQWQRLRVAAQVAKPVKQSDLLEAITAALCRVQTGRERSAEPSLEAVAKLPACASCWPRTA